MREKMIEDRLLEKSVLWNESMTALIDYWHGVRAQHSRHMCTTEIDFLPHNDVLS